MSGPTLRVGSLSPEAREGARIIIEWAYDSEGWWPRAEMVDRQAVLEYRRWCDSYHADDFSDQALTRAYPIFQRGYAAHQQAKIADLF